MVKQLSSKSEETSLVGLVVGLVVGWLLSTPLPKDIVRHIVLAVTRPRVSIRVTGLGFEPFAVCGNPTRALAFARYRLYH